MSRNAVPSSCCAIKVIQVLRQIHGTFHDKDNYFQTHATGFICLSYLLQKVESIKEIFDLAIRLKLGDH